MVLRFLLLVGSCLLSPSWGIMAREDFESFFEPVCFPHFPDQQPLFINGQEKPLSQTMENFIALAEKLEAANPLLRLKDELFYFIKSYTFDNIEFNRLGDLVRWEPRYVIFKEMNTFWEPEEINRLRQPEVEDPFTDGEKCNLFHMITHSIIRTPRGHYPISHTDESSHQFNLDDQYPMELGAVAVRGSNLAVELGRVLRGMYVGLQLHRKVDLSENSRIPKEYLEGHPTEIDRLYAVTLSEVIALCNWRHEVGHREKLAQDGYWVSAPIGMNEETSDICPMIYRLKANESAAFSYSSVRGAADGLILGKIIDSISANNPKVKLSQILRQYYGRGGIFEYDEELGETVWASFCNRGQLIRKIEDILKEQTYLYHLLVATNYKHFPDPFAWDYYSAHRSKIFGIYNREIRDFCAKQYSLDEPDNLPKETPLDIIAVLDTSQTKENIRKQQLILGYFAKEMDLRYYGSRMTILADKIYRLDFGNVTLLPIVEDAFSSACAACAVTQISWGEKAPPSAPEDEVINGINQYLQARKANQTNKIGVRGKVVIYFNLKEEERNAKPTPLQIRVEKALRDLFLKHIEVPMYALGRSARSVKKYARNDGEFALSALDEPEQIVAKNLLRRVIQVPAIIQYPDCKEHKSEKSAVFEYTVSPNAVQHWSIPAKYFYQNKDMKITFESRSSQIKVCHNRATPYPELVKSICGEISSGKKFEFFFKNPCKGFSALNCSPHYFSVIGVNATSGGLDNCIDTFENQCRTLDQINFKITHEGARCS